MPTNRTPLGRSRRPSFDAETLALFMKLDGMKVRNSQAFKDGEHELARRLNLVEEYWTINSVLDREGLCHPPGYIANIHWATCRRVREELLALPVTPRRLPRKTPHA